MAAERRQSMTTTNGIHLYVRPSVGGTLAGHAWIPVPDDGVPADLVDDVGKYLGVSSTVSDWRGGTFVVDAPTWDSVRAEIERERSASAARKAKEEARSAAALAEWRAAAAVYLAGGDRANGLVIDCGQTPDEREQIKAEDLRRHVALVAEKSREIESVIERLAGGEGTLDTPGVRWYEIDNRHVSWATDDIDLELQRRLNVISSQRKADAERAEIAAKARFAAERDHWIREYGSPRLKKALDAGLSDKMRGVYRDERIACELGEDWISWDTVDGGKDTDRINPTESELDALLAAQAKWPKERLDLQIRSIWSNESNDEEGEQSYWRPALMMRLPWDIGLWAVRYLDE